MVETPLNFFRNQILIQKGEKNEEQYEEVFPGVFRRTMTRATFGVPVAVNIFRNYMHPSKVNCILCPEEWLNILQITYKNHFSRAKAFKIKLTQTILQDIRTEEDQSTVIEDVHNRAHRGIEDNQKEIARKFYFPRMKAKVTSFINVCNTCLENKYERNPYKVKFAYTPTPRRPMDILHLDIFISSPDLFLSAVDKLSRYAMLIPVKSRSIPDVKRSLTKLLTTHRTPRLIVCDNEVAFKSPEVRGLLQRLNVEMYNTPSDQSEVNGIVERFHSTLSEIFRCIKPKYPELSNKEIYKIATLLYNESIHSATNLKPVEVFFGMRDGDDRPLDIQKIIDDSNEIFDEVVQKLEFRQKKLIDSRNKTRETEPTFKIGEIIYNKISGIPNKRKSKFKKQVVKTNRRKTIIDERNIKLHKTNFKRKRKR